MLKQACGACKAAGIIAIIGALNWGLIGITGNNFIEGVFGVGIGATKIIYVLMGLSGLALLVSFLLFAQNAKSKNILKNNYRPLMFFLGYRLLFQSSSVRLGALSRVANGFRKCFNNQLISIF